MVFAEKHRRLSVSSIRGNTQKSPPKPQNWTKIWRVLIVSPLQFYCLFPRESLKACNFQHLRKPVGPSNPLWQRVSKDGLCRTNTMSLWCKKKLGFLSFIANMRYGLTIKFISTTIKDRRSASKAVFFGISKIRSGSPKKYIYIYIPQVFSFMRYWKVYGSIVFTKPRGC